MRSCIPLAISDIVSYRRKLKEATEGLTLDMMVRRERAQRMRRAEVGAQQNAPRPGKKLLVLDLDYCILDTGLWKSEAFVADREPVTAAD